jgi:hypothetical protein
MRVVAESLDGSVEDAEISCEVVATESLVKDILCGKEPQSQNLFIQRDDKLFTGLLELISSNSASRHEGAKCLLALDPKQQELELAVSRALDSKSLTDRCQRDRGASPS